MQVSPALDLVAVLAFTGLLAAAALADARRLVIPNGFTFAIAGLYPVHVLAAQVTDWPAALVVGMGLLAVGFTLFYCRFIGGGDAKLVAAVGLWAGPGHVLPFLFVTSMAGAAIGLAMLAHRRWRRVAVAATAGGATPKEELSLPYGAAIAAGGLQVALSLALGG